MSQEAIPCTGCGYDLRGLATDGTCPECDVPIERSLHGGRLEYADAAWLATVTRGQRLVMWGVNLVVFGFLGSIILVPAIALVAAGMSRSLDSSTVALLQAILMIGALLGGLVVAGIGTILVTAPDPRDTGSEAAISTRACARWGMAASIVLITLSSFGEFGAGPAYQIVISVIAIAGFVTFAVGLVAVLLWIAGLAARIPDPDMEASIRRSAKFLSWAIPLLLVYSFLGRTGVFASIGGGTVELLFTLVGCTVAVAAIGLLIHLARLVGSMGRLRRILREIVS